MLFAAGSLSPDPSGHGTHRQLGLPPCAFNLATGKLCPSCGLTTSFAAMARMDVTTATRAHALGPALFVLMAVLAVYFLSKFLFAFRVVLPYRTVLVVNLTAVGLYLAYGIARIVLG
ncbi:MAG: hypothetical protein C4340_04500 [Armatimonadota bacterium]